MNGRLTKADQTELKIMDTVSRCLSSCIDAQITVTLDKRIPLTFVLAKSGSVDEGDRRIAAGFFEVMRNAETWGNVLPFLLLNGAANIRESIRSALFFPAEEGKQVLQTYHPASLEDAFPGLNSQRLSEQYSSTDPVEIFSGMLADMKDAVTLFIADTSRHETSITNFVSVIALAIKIISTGAMQHYATCSEGDSYKSLLRSFIGQYTHRLDRLIHFRQRLYPDKSIIPHRWDEDLPVTQPGDINFAF